MRGLKLIEKFKSTQVHAFNQQDTGNGGCNACVDGSKLRNHKRTKFIGLKSNKTNPVSVARKLLPYGLPSTELLEPSIDPHLKPIHSVKALADLYKRFETNLESGKWMLCVEQYAYLYGLGDAKLLRRCLGSARQYAVDVHSKVVLSSWLRFERREDELVGISSMDCSGFILECPKAALVSGYDSNSTFDHCKCCEENWKSNQVPFFEKIACLSLEEEDGVTFFIGDENINFVRSKIAALSSPLKAMLSGGFVESKKEKIDFSHDGISLEGMRAVEVYSRTRRVDMFCPGVVLELLSFANRFCCEEMKSDCDAHLSSVVGDIEDALVLIDYGLEERANLLVASCLQVLLRELPSYLYNPKVMKIFCNSEATERLADVGHSSFLLYYFLSLVSMEESRVSNTTVKLLERMWACSTEGWQRMLAFHQLGCVMLERGEYKDACYYFEAAADAGHIYSLAGLARAKYKQGQQYLAYQMIVSIISENKPTGWMYQERSLYNLGREKIADLNYATELDPTLSFPYKYRAVAKMEEGEIRAAIAEIDRIIVFNLSVDCLELRAWLFISAEDYERALRDTLALLTLDPNYMMFQGRVSGDHLVKLLSHQVCQWSPADFWIQLYDRWSSVDDIGSLGVIHQMLINEPGKSFLRFRQSLLLLRLNCQKAAMRCLRIARNDSTSEHERLVYEGWILYDTGHRDEALSRAEKSISVERTFEAFFLKAYILADRNLDPESSTYVTQLLEEALRCPSDGLRKGQALNNLGSIYMECGKLDQAESCYINALDIKHTRAHQGLARVYHLKNQRKAAYEEMSKLMEKAQNNASAFEKRSEYCDREMAKNDLNMATQLDPLRTYPYRYRAAVLMDDKKEAEAVEELSKAIAFKPELQMLHLRAAFYEAIGDLTSALQDSQAALCLDPNHMETLDLYNRTREQSSYQQK